MSVSSWVKDLGMQQSLLNASVPLVGICMTVQRTLAHATAVGMGSAMKVHVLATWAFTEGIVFTTLVPTHVMGTDGAKRASANVTRDLRVPIAAGLFARQAVADRVSVWLASVCVKSTG